MSLIHCVSTLVALWLHRDYRRYFYTHKRLGHSQWDYPDTDEIQTQDAKASHAQPPGLPELKAKQGKEAYLVS